MNKIFETQRSAISHRKEIEIQGCVEVPMELSQDEFFDQFISFLETNH